MTQRKKKNDSKRSSNKNSKFSKCSNWQSLKRVSY